MKTVISLSVYICLILSNARSPDDTLLMHYCKTLIFGGYYILVVLAVYARAPKYSPPIFDFQYIYVRKAHERLE